MKVQIANTDRNHSEVIHYLKERGFRVWSLHKAGDGIPDLLVLEPTQKLWVLLEVKVPGAELRGKQIEFFVDTAGAPRHIVESGPEAIEIMNQYKKR